MGNLMLLTGGKGVAGDYEGFIIFRDNG